MTHPTETYLVTQPNYQTPINRTCGGDILLIAHCHPFGHRSLLIAQFSDYPRLYLAKPVQANL